MQDSRYAAGATVTSLSSGIEAGGDTTEMEMAMMDRRSRVISVADEMSSRIESKAITMLNTVFAEATDVESMRAVINAQKDKHGVLVISKSHCPFCEDLKMTLNMMHVQFGLVEVDQISRGDVTKETMKADYSHKTFPGLFVGGEFIGGCSDFKAHVTNGTAFQLVRKYVNESSTESDVAALERDIWMPRPLSADFTAQTAFFYFPESVNVHVVRLTGAQAAILSLCGIVLTFLLDKPESIHWVMFGLFIDYIMRMLFGVSNSPLGLTATLLVANVQPRFAAGPPKQFASLCGAMFSGFGWLCYRLDQPYIGAAILAILFACAGMEAAIDFCVGCYFYGLGIRFGLIPRNVYKLHTTMKAESIRTWEEMFIPKNEGAYGSGVARGDPSDVVEFPTDCHYKTKTDEQKQEDFDMVRFMTLGKFNLALNFLAVGLAFYSLSSSNTKPFAGVNKEIWQFLVIFGLIVYLIYLVLYAVKAVRFPSKVVKEWQNPLLVNNAASIFMNLTMFSFFLSVYTEGGEDGTAKSGSSLGSASSDVQFAQFLWWVGSFGCLIMSVLLVAHWLQHRITMEVIDISFMFAPLGCLVSVIVAPSLAGRSFHTRDFAWFLYAVGVFMYAVLMPITFYKVMIDANADGRRRHAVSLWVGAPAAICLAHQSLRLFELETTGVFEYGFTDFELLMYWASFFMMLVMAASFFTSFLGRVNFSEAYYAYTFPLALVGVCGVRYVIMKGKTDRHGAGNDFMRFALVYFVVGAATWSLVVNFLWSLIQIARKQLFRPMMPKWGVLSFMRLTHFAFHNWIDIFGKKLNELGDAIANGDPQSDILIRKIVADWNMMCIVHQEHARHEDEVIFIESKTVFPEFSKPADDDHVAQEKVIKEMSDKIDAALSSGDVQQFVPIMDEMKAFAEDLERHLLWEEAHMQPVLRKYLPNGLQIDVVRRVWRCTPYHRWNMIIPWVLNHQYKHMQRVMWLHTLCWAMPERCQMIGLLASRGVQDSFWARIAQDMPEIIPRGLPGWRRQI